MQLSRNTKKQKLLIVIDNLKKGGAETLLVGILPELNREFEVILVTLTNGCDFNLDNIICSKRYVLNFKGKISFLTCIIKLRKIIKATSPVLIHAHLFYSSLAARVACPSKTPVLYSVHNELSKNIFNGSEFYKQIEKLTISKNHALVGVSKLVLDDYAKSISLPKKHFILRNYVMSEFLQPHTRNETFDDFTSIRMVAVGNVKDSKNYSYLIDTMLQLKNYPVSVDIYGSTESILFPKLLDVVTNQGLKVSFKGSVDNIHELLPSYNIYVLCSTHEGFGIAAVEAMAMGVPAMLSDIPVLREVTLNNALFFSLSEHDGLSKLLKEVLAGRHDMNVLSSNGIVLSKKYTKEIYLQELFKIYDEILD